MFNLTPHMIRLNDGREFPPCGVIPRVGTTYTVPDDDGVVGVRFGVPTGLPDKQEGILLIVSAILADACPGRDDLVSPATGHPDCVRKDGQVYSVPFFTRKVR